MVQLGLKVYVFGGADRYDSYIAPAPVVEGKMELTEEDIARQRKLNESESQRQRQREVAEAAAMIIVGAPLYLYHWKTIQKEAKKSKS